MNPMDAPGERDARRPTLHVEQGSVQVARRTIIATWADQDGTAGNEKKSIIATWADCFFL